MTVQEAVRALSYQERIAILHDKKLSDTKEKQDLIGAMDHDDWAQILPPPAKRLVTEAISGSGEKIRDVLLDPDHPHGLLMAAFPLEMDPTSCMVPANGPIRAVDSIFRLVGAVAGR